jgi:DNA-binding transcriptional LysR family regulator
VPPMMNESFHTLLCDFAANYPEVRLQVHSSSQLVDLQRDGYDVAIRASSQIEPGLIARTLSREPLLAVASPAYLEQHGTPRTRRDLRSHRCLMGFARGALPESHWSVSGGGKLHVEGSFFSNDVGLLSSAALRGLGIAFLPLMLVHAHLESGALVAVLRGVIAAEARIAVVYREREFVPTPVRAFVDAVVAWAPGALGQAVPERCREAARRESSDAEPASRTRKRKRAA